MLENYFQLSIHWREKMSEELLINRLQHDVQTLKEKVDCLQKEMKEVKQKEFEEFIKHSECNLP